MLFVREVISENNSAILIIPISRWQLLSSRHEIRRGHVIAKYMCVFVFHKTHAVRNLGSSQSCRLVKSMNVFENEKKIVSLFFVKAKTKEGKKAFSCEVTADQSLWATKVLSATKTNGYKKSKNMNANRIRVKSSRISPASLLTWTEFREKDVSFIV